MCDRLPGGVEDPKVVAVAAQDEGHDHICGDGGRSRDGGRSQPADHGVGRVTGAPSGTARSPARAIASPIRGTAATVACQERKAE